MRQKHTGPSSERIIKDIKRVKPAPVIAPRRISASCWMVCATISRRFFFSLSASALHTIKTNTSLEVWSVFFACIHVGTRMDDLLSLKWSGIKPNETVFRPSKGREYKGIARIPAHAVFQGFTFQLFRF